MSGSGDDPKRPRMTSGPSQPVHGEPQRKPFGRDTSPGRDDAPTHHSPTSHAVHFSLPTGGGALRSIGETVSANPFTGAASVSVPIATSPGRGGFGPALSLRYGSGLGNGPFGLGWQLDLPSISRKTEKGLPEYRDDDPDLHRRDTFIFAGAEDLVHELDDTGEVWSQQRDGFVVHRFRPRVESDFTRIERWTAANGDTHWRTISPNNVTSYFGRTLVTRIHDPLNRRRVFAWLLDEQHDDRGNIIVYEYTQENLDRVNPNTPAERPRLIQTDIQPQRYLSRIRYGNAQPFQAGGWLFEVVFDYGGHGTWRSGQLEVTPNPVRPWPARLDTFSNCRPGFDIRTRRLCRRVLMFHHFEHELGPDPYLVASTDFIHAEDPAVTRLTGVIQRSYRRDEQTGYYEVASLPTLEFDYTPAALNPRLTESFEPSSMNSLPWNYSGRQFRLVDLDGEGLPGVLIEQAGLTYYKRGLGRGRLGPMLPLPTKPNLLGTPGTQLVDIDGDGRLELVSYTGLAPGFHRRTEDEGWGGFEAFASVPNIDWQNPHLQLIDLTGDGFPDILTDTGDAFVWYRSKGAEGFEPPRVIPHDRQDATRPILMHAHAQVAIHLADMTGDGLADIVRIANGEVVYWPNLGHGRFGEMIHMPGLEPFEGPSSFHPIRLRLADVDGSGTTDIVYLTAFGAKLYRNLAGNAFAPVEVIRTFPGVRDNAWTELLDFEGHGTAQLVWTGNLPEFGGPVLRSLDLMGGRKPHLLCAVRNNMGGETKLEYATSTRFFRADQQSKRNWVTKLPFPVQVVERIETLDHVTRRRFTRRFAYHHGYFDGQEREFRGFGMVESWDTELYSLFERGRLFKRDQFEAGEGTLHQPPVYTKSWFHTGAFLGRDRISRVYPSEYWREDEQAFKLPDSVLPAELDGEGAREAVRALAGRVLRTEVYAVDGTPFEGNELRERPYAVTEANYEVRRVQGRGPNRHAVFLAHDRESLTHHYERNPLDPRVAHTAVLEVDYRGVVRRSAAVAYPRRGQGHRDEQARLHVTLAEADVVHREGDDDSLRIGVPVESRTHELHGLVAPSGRAFTWQDLHEAAANAVPIGFDASPSGAVEKRLLSRSRMRYFADDLSGPLPQGVVQSKALAFDSDTMVMTDSLRQQVFGQFVSDAELEQAGAYLFDDAAWWARSGHPTYDPTKFYAVTTFTDPHGNPYTTTFDAHALLAVASTDPLGNTVSVEHDYRLLTPWQLTDANGNRTQVRFDVLGFVIASAVMGKVGDDDGDTLDDPTSTFEYDLRAWQTSRKPNWARTRVREIHQDPNTRWLEQRAYFSGLGATIMVKAQARPGLAPQRDDAGALMLDEHGKPVLADTSPNLRWVGTGRVVVNNKGNVVKAYEPYYSSTPEFEDEAELVEQGVTAVHHYDPLGRLIRTDLPNGTFTKVEFTPWQQISWDAHDTVLDSDWYATRIGYEGQDAALVKERRAAELAAAHANTPTTVHLDSLGRAFVSVAHNGGDEYLETRSVLDIRGNVLEVIDARGNTAETRVFDMLGSALHVSSIDAGERRYLAAATGEPLRSWDSRSHRFSFTYDALRRPVDRTVSVDGGPEKLLDRVIYGELLEHPAATNHRGRAYQTFDSAGMATTTAFDFEGHAVTEQRRLVAQRTEHADWSALLGHGTVAAMSIAAAPLLDAETFSASSQRDALGRVLTAVSPDGSEVAYGYDEGGGLQRVDLRHRGRELVETVVGDIHYNARGQRERVIHGSANSPTTTTTYDYDPQTFRLARVITTRGSDQATLQRLHYTHDAVGNVTDIRDSAQQTVYFANAVVEAANSYVYDPLYRLIEATGREHAGHGTGQRTHEQLPIGPQPMMSDPTAMRRYTQRFEYDAAGNILRMQHSAGNNSWTRRYQYADNSNRLLATSAPGDPANVYSHTYTHDPHGNMTAMPHLAAMDWNHDNQLEHATAGAEQVHFQYGGDSRARKFTIKPGVTTEERIYLGPFELYRKRVNGQLELERESLHISDGTGRICIVETKTVHEAAPVQNPAPVWRYQLGNHLGTATTEVTQAGEVISHEEFHAYGTSAYRAVDASIDVSPKRYRYTGMERDDETGLGYHTARYYAPWLGRWTAADPIGLKGGLNRYRYASNSPSTTNDRSGCAPPDPKRSTPAPQQTPGDESSLVTETDAEIRARADYFDVGITKMIYYGAEQQAQIIYDDGGSITIDTSDIRTAKYSKRTPGTAAYGVNPEDVAEDEIDSDYLFDPDSGRVLPSEINPENAPVFIEMLRQGRTEYDRGTRATAEAGITIYSDPAFQAAVLAPGVNQLVTPTLVRPAPALRPAPRTASRGGPTDVWQVRPFRRGQVIEKRLDQNLPNSFPTIDRFKDGIATSIKSMDLGAKTYQDMTKLRGTVKGYIDKLAKFQGAQRGPAQVSSEEITGRTLELVIPKHGGSAEQMQVLEDLVKYAKTVGVHVKIIRF